MVAAAACAEIRFAVSWLKEPPVAPPLSPEASLVRLAARGEKQAFSRLVEQNKRAVYGLCLRLLCDTEEASDAAQEAFARAYAAMGSFDPSLPFSPWILRIARNHCLDELRRRLPARQKLELDAEPDGDGPDHREIADPASPRGDEALERAELRNTLEATVAGLPPNYREAIQLFHVEHLSYKEMAAAMDVPIGTIMTWLHRARARLKEALADKEVAP
jgi:RNA polymerase sigma-70 factor (ECF subfamily)